MFESLAFVLGQRRDQRESQHQRLDRLQAQDDQRVADGSDALAAAIKTGIDRAENF
jgi:hypothetical protein